MTDYLGDWNAEEDDGETLDDIIVTLYQEPFHETLKRYTIGAWQLGHSYFRCPFCHQGTIHLYRRWRDAVPQFLKGFGLRRINAARGKCTACGMEISPTVGLPWPFIPTLERWWGNKHFKNLRNFAVGLALVGIGMWSSGSWRNALLSVGAVLLFVIALNVRDGAMYHTKPRKLNGWKWFLIEYLFFLITIVAFSMIWPK